jgi:RNA polymerase sigma factor (sigma-70 family)
VVVGDDELLTAAKGGDGEAFAVFYRRHVAAITGFHRRRVGSAELALPPIVLDDRALEHVDARSSPGALEQALRELPDAEREAIELRVLQDQDYGEIAQQLRCSPAVVRQRVSRGLRRLRDTVEDRT